MVEGQEAVAVLDGERQRGGRAEGEVDGALQVLGLGHGGVRVAVGEGDAVDAELPVALAGGAGAEVPPVGPVGPLRGGVGAEDALCVVDLCVWLGLVYRSKGGEE